MIFKNINIAKRKEIKMEIETFECIEVSAEAHPEVEAESLKLIEELGLLGQAPSEKEDGTEIRVPYREITKNERCIYMTLCPQSYEVSEYSRSPIPLRVLQVIAHATQLEYFDSLEIWDVEDTSIKDPVLVGHHTGNDKYKTQTTYLLARWGEVLEPLAVLAPKAAQVAKEKYISKLKKAKGELESVIASSVSMDDLDSFCRGSGRVKDVYLSTDW